MVERARLESVCTFTRTEGSNPSLSGDNYGGRYWSPRSDKSQTPSDPEGSSGSDGLGCADQAGNDCHHFSKVNKTLHELPSSS